MHHVLLLHDVETDASTPGTPEWDADVAAFDRFGEVVGDAIVGGEALTPSPDAVVVRPASGQVTDGPFTETAEVIGGLFVLDVADLAEAIAMAAAVPTATTGAVEVRAVAGTWAAPADPPAGTRRFVAILHEAPSAADDPTDPAWDAAAAEHGAFAAAHGAAVLGGAALHPASAATTVRVRDGRTAVTDGPFTETTEVVGGLYLLAAADRDAAIAVAGDLPVGDGAVELREVVEMDG